MSDTLTHECGIALIRLRQPIEYYVDTYGDAFWGMRNLYLLMEKQRNRGQDGIGIGCMKLCDFPGSTNLFTKKSIKHNAINQLFSQEVEKYESYISNTWQKFIDDNDSAQQRLAKIRQVERQIDFCGQVIMGHLRYGTSGGFSKNVCHPYIKQSVWSAKSVMVQGNFNMTNTAELYQRIKNRGQDPIFSTDTQLILEDISYALEKEYNTIEHQLQLQHPELNAYDINLKVKEQLNTFTILSKAARYWDGGFIISGVLGNGDTFIMRDPHGIRPCFFLQNKEVFCFTSERVPLMTVFNVSTDDVTELPPGHIAIIKKDGSFQLSAYTKEQQSTPCSFENIYFSRGNDPKIYNQRKAMGRHLVQDVLQVTGEDFSKMVFSYIPNTAATGYMGLMEGLRHYQRNKVKSEMIALQESQQLTADKINDLILHNWPVSENITHKDEKLRTFISQKASRNHLSNLVYDISYDVVSKNDTLIVLDDSIVRGTTLRNSILKMLIRTGAKKIVICSTAPQIRYPDYYGIDMSELGEFIAFQAAISLAKKQHPHILSEVHQACQTEILKEKSNQRNQVHRIYDLFSVTEISKEIAQLLTPNQQPKDKLWQGEIAIIYQSIENLHKAIATPCGDWYFTGNYPTAGGHHLVNKAYINWYNQKDTSRVNDLPL